MVGWREAREGGRRGRCRGEATEARGCDMRGARAAEHPNTAPAVPARKPLRRPRRLLPLLLQLRLPQPNPPQSNRFCLTKNQPVVVSHYDRLFLCLRVTSVMSVKPIVKWFFATGPSSSSENDLHGMSVWFVVKGSSADVLRFAFRGLWKLFFVSRSGFFGRWVFAACAFMRLPIGLCFKEETL